MTVWSEKAIWPRLSSGKTETDVVVAVAGFVPVAVSGTDVPAVVDPGTAAHHTVIAVTTVTPKHPGWDIL